MKTEDLKAKGLTEEQIAFVFSENGKDVNNAKKDYDNLKAEADKYKKQYEEAQKVLDGFNGVDVDALKKDIETYKKAAEDAEKSFKQQIADRDFSDNLSKAIREHKGINEKAIKALLDIDTLKASKNQNDDIKAAIEKLKTQDDSKMLFGDQKTGKAHFSNRNDGSGSDGQSRKTREEIMAVKDDGERQKLIAENIELFQ